MVTINFTIFVELGLFLIFLWGASRFIVCPAIQVTDTREAELDQRKSDAETDLDEAESIEGRYATEIVSLRRMSEDEFRAGRGGFLQEHTETLGKHRHEADAVVETALLEAQAQVDAARADVARLAPELALAIERHLDVGGES
jgi:F0F1-type ATP synthase membrane subunit b/b'